MSVRFRALSLFFALHLVGFATPVLAWQHNLTCEGRFRYRLTYDDTLRRLTIDVEGMKRRLQLRQVKEDEEGLLIWASTPAFGGDRDMLIRIGREKWVRTYFRNGSEETIKCR